jgi:hypothetical protein
VFAEFAAGVFSSAAAKEYGQYEALIASPRIIALIFSAERFIYRTRAWQLPVLEAIHYKPSCHSFKCVAIHNSFG